MGYGEGRVECVTLCYVSPRSTGKSKVHLKSQSMEVLLWSAILRYSISKQTIASVTQTCKHEK